MFYNIYVAAVSTTTIHPSSQLASPACYPFISPLKMPLLLTCREENTTYILPLAAVNCKVGAKSLSLSHTHYFSSSSHRLCGTQGIVFFASYLHRWYHIIIIISIANVVVIGLWCCCFFVCVDLYMNGSDDSLQEGFFMVFSSFWRCCSFFGGHVVVRCTMLRFSLNGCWMVLQSFFLSINYE